MTNYKPFNIIITEMKEGDFAECQGRNRGIKLEQGVFRYTDSDGNASGRWYLETDDFNYNYRILPKYINWDEAQKAILKGKTVIWHAEKRDIKLHNYRSFAVLSQEVGGGLVDLLNGKFSILEGC